MTTTQSSTPTRRTMLAGTIGLGALGATAFAPAAHAALSDPALPSDPGIKMYLRLSGFAGDVTERGFVDQFELLTFGAGAKSTNSPMAGTGSGSGKASPDPLMFAVRTGPWSPRFLAAVNSGKAVSSGEVSLVKPGEAGGYKFLTVTFQQAVLTDYFITPHPTDGRPLDVVELKFVRLAEAYYPQNQDGTPGTPVWSGWDYSKNKAL